MEDLARLGAFERSCYVASPTGNGYANDVAIETLEHQDLGLVPRHHRLPAWQVDEQACVILNAAPHDIGAHPD